MSFSSPFWSDGANRALYIGYIGLYSTIWSVKKEKTPELQIFHEIPMFSSVTSFLFFPSEKNMWFSVEKHPERRSWSPQNRWDCRFFWVPRGSGLRPSRICHAHSLDPFQCPGQGFGCKKPCSVKGFGREKIFWCKRNSPSEGRDCSVAGFSSEIHFTEIITKGRMNIPLLPGCLGHCTSF